MAFLQPVACESLPEFDAAERPHFGSELYSPRLSAKLCIEAHKMVRKSLVVFVICISLALVISVFAAGDTPTRSNLSAAAIVDRNVAARGGLQAWRAVLTMSMEGKLGAGGNQRATLPAPPQQGPMPSLKSIPQRPVSETGVWLNPIPTKK